MLRSAFVQTVASARAPIPALCWRLRSHVQCRRAASSTPPATAGIAARHYGAAAPAPAEQRSFSSPARTSARVAAHNVHVSWADGFESSFYGLWLRDHCTCAECYYPATQQRLSNISQFSPTIAPRHVEVRGDNLMAVWDDGHVSEYSLDRLRQSVGQSNKYPKRRFWGASVISALPQITHEQLMRPGKDGPRECLRLLSDYGFVLVNGVPSSLQAIEEAVGRMMPPMETFFGKMWQFDNENLEHADTAYTGIALASHTDGCYMQDPPGLQVFQCLELGGPETGGESTLVDGFQVARQLRDRSPAHHAALSTVGVPYQYIDTDREIHHVAAGPCFAYDAHTIELVQVRYNASDRAPLTAQFVKMQQLPSLYSAFRAVEDLMKDPMNQIKSRLTPGRMLIIDNWRVLHGRTAVHPKARRTMGGCYVRRDDFLNALRQHGLHGH